MFKPNGLFTLPDLNTDSDYDGKLNVYIVLCSTFHTACIQIKIPILTETIGIGSQSEPESESRYVNVNKA